MKFLLDSSPVNNARSDDVVKLEDDQAVGQIAVKMMYEGWRAHTVHPVSVHCNSTIFVITYSVQHLKYYFRFKQKTLVEYKLPPQLASHNVLVTTGAWHVIITRWNYQASTLPCTQNEEKSLDPDYPQQSNPGVLDTEYPHSLRYWNKHIVYVTDPHNQNLAIIKYILFYFFLNF